MPTRNHPRIVTDLEREEGIAMILAVLLLLLVTGIAISAIQHAGDESALTGSARRAARTFFAADAGIQVAINQLSQGTPDLTAFNVALEGGAVTVRSGTRADAGPMPLLAAGSGPPPDGYSINLGRGFRSRLYRTGVTSLEQGGSSAELDVKLARLQIGNGSYR